MKNLYLILALIINVNPIFGQLKVYKLQPNELKSSLSFPVCDYISVQNDTIIFISEFQYRYDQKVELAVRGMASLTLFQNNFYQLFIIGGSSFAVREDVKIEYYDVPLVREKNITINMPNCNHTELKVRLMFPENGNFSSSSDDVSESIDKYLSHAMITKGSLTLPYYATEDFDCTLILFPIEQFTSNLIGQYFGVNSFPVRIHLKKDKRITISFPNISSNTLTQFFFLGEYINITEEKIHWKNCIFERINNYPEEIEHIMSKIPL